MNEKKTLWIFSLSAMLLFTAMVFGAAWKQGWFLPRQSFTIRFPTANGLFVGTPVLLSGLRIGEVSSVDLDDDGRVVARVKVLSKYVAQLRDDASANSERTFVIGEKIIALSPGSRDRPPLKEGAELAGHEAMEITDLLSGSRITKYFETFQILMDQLNALISVASDKDHNLASLYLQLHTSLKGIESLSKDVRVLRTDVLGSNETKMLLSNLSKSSRDMESVMGELRTGLPRINATMPTLTKALQESVVTLQAMQKSFFLRSSVKELKEEQQVRLPASEKASESP
ncbi:MAG: MlaD family protein [Bdellovibrionota bacterium]